MRVGNLYIQFSVFYILFGLELLFRVACFRVLVLLSSFFSPFHNLLYCRGSGYSFHSFSGWKPIQLPWYARINKNNIRNDDGKLESKTSVLYKLVVVFSNYYKTKNLYCPLMPFSNFDPSASQRLQYINRFTQS